MEELPTTEQQQNKSQESETIFAISTNNGDSGELIFRENGVEIKINKTCEPIHYSDLIGFSEEKISSDRYKIQINSYPKLKKLFKKEQRYLCHSNIFIQATGENLQSLKVLLLKHTTNRKIASSKQSLRFLIFFNPMAGSNSKAHLQKVKNFLAYTNFYYDLVETDHRNHCKEFLSDVDVGKYEGVIIISGDGLMHQFVNSTAVQKLPVTHVPAGSGNAFAKTQTTMAGERCTDQIAIYLAVKGRQTPMNLIKMELEKEPHPIYSFLSLEWAFLADIDMNSEFLRMFGGLRFQMYSAYRCLALKRYSGKLTFSETEANLPPLNQPITNESFKVLQTNFLNAIFCSIPFISDKYEFAPLLKVEDQAVDMQLTTEGHGRWQLVKYLLASEKGDHFDREKGCKKEGFNFENAKVKCYRLEPKGQNENKGLFGIDGESYEAQKMQASVSSKKMMTFI